MTYVLYLVKQKSMLKKWRLNSGQILHFLLFYMKTSVVPEDDNISPSLYFKTIESLWLCWSPNTEVSEDENEIKYLTKNSGP